MKSTWIIRSEMFIKMIPKEFSDSGQECKLDKYVGRLSATTA